MNNRVLCHDKKHFQNLYFSLIWFCYPLFITQRIETNLPRSEVPLDFVDKAIPVFAEALGKPDTKCVCTLVPDMLISFGGDSSLPGATANLMSIGKLGPEENKHISKVLADFIQKQLGIPSERFLLTYQDEKSYNVSIRGTTAQVLEG